MPQLSAGKKALRSSARRRAHNDLWRGKMRSATKAVRVALESKDKAQSAIEIGKLESIIDRAARRNIIHPNKAARKKSRLRRMVAAL